MSSWTTPQRTRPPAIQRWLVRHPRFQPALHAYVLVVDELGGALVRRAHQQMAAPGDTPLDKELDGGHPVRGSSTWNDDPRPFVWHKTADEILESLAAYLSLLQ